MATGTFYLRPSADISVGHTLYPEDSTAAYLLINEEESDTSSTYIAASSLNKDGNLEYFSSEFSLSGIIPEGRFQIENITACMVAKLGSVTTSNSELSITANGVTSTFGCDAGTQSAWTSATAIVTDTALLDAINDYISNNDSFPNITLTINTSIAEEADNNDGKNSGGDISITQVYLELTYSLGLNIHTKSNGVWLQAQAAYQKQNGAWVEITEDECKNILQSNLLGSGG